MLSPLFIKLFTELYLKDYISPYKSIGTVEDIVFQNTLNLLIGIKGDKTPKNI